MSSSILATDIVDKVFDSLYGRGGFDHWWDMIDKDIQKEILDELTVVVERALTNNT